MPFSIKLALIWNIKAQILMELYMAATMYLKKLFQRSKSDLWNNIAWEGRAILDSNITPFFRFVNKWAIYRLGIISLAHGSVHVTDFPVVKVTYMLMNCHEICSNLAA
jgi:hypothetical protein